MCRKLKRIRNMNEILTGKKLYGDDFCFDQIQQWYEQESEGYADIASKDGSKYFYSYHKINEIHGFRKIKIDHFENVLGFGSAWGDEFEPIINKITNLTIIEPSDSLRSKRIGEVIPNYVKPEIDGSIKYNDNSFDLITCFGTLHHIPNVTFVLGELIRVLKPNGYLLLREPIVSMGDWRFPRTGLTRNERGIPICFFDNLLNDNYVTIVSKEFCFTATNAIHRIVGRFFKRPIFSYTFYVLLDKAISSIFKINIHYHAERKIHKIAPSCVSFVIKKLPPIPAKNNRRLIG